MRIKTIIISNTAEAFRDIIGKIKNPQKKLERVRLENDLSIRALLWEADDKIIITPSKLPKDLIDLNKKVLKFNNIINLFPLKTRCNLSSAILRDKKLFKKLCDIIKENPGVNLTSYCVTSEFIKLTDRLRDEGLSFEALELPEDHSRWLVSYLDSKVGSRTEISKIKSISKNIPESIICKNKKEVLEVANWFIKNDHSCTLKSNFGESGWGTLFLLKEKIKSKNEISQHIKKEFEKDPIWENTLILVEEYIYSKKEFPGNSPSVELLLSSSGFKITYLCNQAIGRKGDFFGIALGKINISAKIEKELREISSKIGQKFWELGYRGFFDIDFVLDIKNTPFVIETNMRRTGGTHVYDVKKLLSDTIKNCYLISQDNFNYKSDRLNPRELIKKVKNILYPIKNKPKGIIISTISESSPSFGFISVGNSQKESREIYNKLIRIFNKK